MILTTNITVSYKTCQDYRPNLPMYVTTKCRMPPGSIRTFLAERDMPG